MILVEFERPREERDPWCVLTCQSFPHELPAVGFAEVDIHQQDVDPLGLENAACRVCAVCLEHAESLQLEIETAEHANSGLVVDDEHGAAARRLHSAASLALAMIAASLRQTLRSGSPRAYAAAMAGLWIDLRLTLARLDTLAADAELGLDDAAALPALQYELHSAGELVAGLEPPPETELLHSELADALAEARDLTADIAEALETGGPEAVVPMLWEWRGSLFRIRFVRLRLERPRTVPAPIAAVEAPQPRTPPPVTAGVVALGSALVLLAALLGLWLLVGLTLAGTLVASVLLRP